MTLSVSEQMKIFLVMLLTGAASGLLFDFFRAIRRVFGYEKRITGTLDLIFWIICAAGVFSVSYYVNNADFRWYEFFAVAAGAVIYFFALSAVFLAVMTWIVRILMKIFLLFLKILLTPLRFLYKIFKGIYGFVSKKAAGPKRKAAQFLKRLLRYQKKQIKKVFLFWKKT